MEKFGKNKKVLLNGPPYIHARQLPYCCAPACLYMILVRRGINPDSQEAIAEELGLMVPPKWVRFFPSIIVELSRGQFGGCRTHLPEFSINRYFKKKGLPLKETYYTIEKIEATKKFAIEFIIENLRAGNDLIVCFNNEILHGNTNWGHASLVQAIEGKHVTLIDPAVKAPDTVVKLSDLILAMRLHGRRNRGGFWVISEKIT